MNIKLNGEDYITEAKTIAHLLKEINIIPERVAVELNLKLIKKGQYTVSDLKDGDQVEVVSFVGGGAE